MGLGVREERGSVAVTVGLGVRVTVGVDVGIRALSVGVAVEDCVWVGMAVEDRV